MDTIDCLPSCHQPSSSPSVMVWNCPHVFHEECLRQWPQLEVADHLPARCPTCEALYVGPEGEPGGYENAGAYTLMCCFWAPILAGVTWLALEWGAMASIPLWFDPDRHSGMDM